MTGDDRVKVSIEAEQEPCSISAEVPGRSLRARSVKGTAVWRGPVKVTRRSGAEAKRAFGARVEALLDAWAEPRFMSYVGYTGVCWLAPGGDYTNWSYQIICPDGRKGGHQGGLSDANEAEHKCRLHMSQYGTDYLDDESVIAGAMFLFEDQRPSHLSYAAWQRARQAADALGPSVDKHRWASDHQDEYLPALEQAWASLVRAENG